ncbi:MAG TPA: hypothetical protein GX517_07335 [Alicyclobacillus sp.]|nr:hypothetical protein [Alicyclobacillus sp.]
MNITITIQAPELVLAIEDLAQALHNLQSGGVMKAVPAVVEERTPEPAAVEEPAEAAQEPEEPVDIETVRAELAVLAKKGKSEVIRTLFQKFGAERLPEIPPARYPELLAEARKLA